MESKERARVVKGSSRKEDWREVTIVRRCCLVVGRDDVEERDMLRRGWKMARLHEGKAGRKAKGEVSSGAEYDQGEAG